MNAANIVGGILLVMTFFFGYAAYKSLRVQSKAGLVFVLIAVALALASITGAIAVFVTGAHSGA